MEDRILVTSATLPEYDEYINEIKSIWDNHWLTNMGVKHKELESNLKDYLKVDRISLFANGHMALELLLQAMDIKGEVITTPYTFASTTHAIVRNGLTPVFCDIREDDYTIDVDRIESLITPETSAILPVHVYGNICDVEAIEDIAKRHNLKVIYDAAHTFGVEYKGRGIASYGDASMLSFHATKVYNTIEGGAVCFSNEMLGEKLYQLKNFGIKNEEVVNGIGANAKMNEFSAAMGICNLRHVDEQIELRKELTMVYREQLSDVPGIRMCNEQKDVKHNYAYMPIYVDPERYGHNRNELFEYLAGHNIHARKYFYPITSAFECYEGRFDPSLTPVASKTSHNILTIPIYPTLGVEAVTRISKHIAEFAVK
ncbi:MAG: DegT/DnrJ/EryC1/StrS family aminotransferase [Lachnospiraceae bacterium]|nr:DegT/DnrJ/EryC1/StrS family aminotransferase [Candidatus Colinaster scatohippi]